MGKISKFMSDVLDANTTPADVTTAPAEVTTKPKSLEEKLAAARKLVAKYEAQIAAGTIKDDTQVNDEITFNFGRGDKVRSLTGRVVAIKDDEKLGRSLKVLSGEGFDAETLTVHIRAVTANATADTRVPATNEELPQTTQEMEQIAQQAQENAINHVDPLTAA